MFPTCEGHGLGVEAILLFGFLGLAELRRPFPCIKPLLCASAEEFSVLWRHRFLIDLTLGRWSAWLGLLRSSLLRSIKIGGQLTFSCSEIG
jgi:hypothetical protein